MAKSGGPTVGLDIGSKQIKVAEAVAGRNGVQIRALGVAPTPEGAVDNGIVVDPKALGNTIKVLLKQCGVGSRSSVSSVAGQGSLVVRVIEVPRQSDTELLDHMKWEVERHVPFAADQVMMDYQPIERADTPPDSPNMEVLLAVAQRDMIDRHVAMLKLAGLKPSGIDVEPLASARSLVELGPDPFGQKTVAIVNIGAQATDVAVIRDGILAFPRTLPIGGDMMTQAIMQQTGHDAEQSEQLKVDYAEVVLGHATGSATPEPSEGFFDFGTDAGGGFDLGATPAAPAAVPEAPAADVDPTTMTVFSAIAPCLGDLLQEIQRSLEYYQSRAAEGGVNEVLLCGGSAYIRNLDKYLENELGIPVRVANPFQYTTVTAKGYTPDQLEALAPTFAVAVGLAARGMVAAPAKAKPAAAPRKRGKK